MSDYWVIRFRKEGSLNEYWNNVDKHFFTRKEKATKFSMYDLAVREYVAQGFSASRIVAVKIKKKACQFCGKEK